MIDKSLIKNLDLLISLHRKNDDIWADFFQSSREKILKDPAFGCDYLLTGWCGMGAYDDECMFENEQDEQLRKTLHPEIYKMAIEIKNDRN